MIAMLKGLALGTLILVAFHALVALYIRSLWRESLEKQFDSGQGTGDRDKFITEGMKAYARSWAHRLLFAIYLVPVVATLVIVYVVNRG